jgi:NTP pyrophosphatase (non-canonical NTP hydrolase)
MDKETNIHELKEKMRQFAEDRDWDQYHNAKELAIGIVTEGSELLHHFRFKSKKEVDEMFKSLEKKDELSEELVDIFGFVLRLAQRYDIDLTTVLDKKIEKNALRYPIEKAKGSNKRYRELS